MLIHSANTLKDMLQAGEQFKSPLHLSDVQGIILDE